MSSASDTSRDGVAYMASRASCAELVQREALVDVARALALGDLVRDLLDAVAVLHAQQLEGGGLLERVEVLALDVLHQLHLVHGLVVEVVAQQHRHREQLGDHRAAPAPLAGDDLVRRLGRHVRRVGNARARQRPHDDRLQHALLADAGGHRVEAVHVEPAALARVRGAVDDLGGRNIERPPCAVGLQVHACASWATG
jgi:hypothetical protein